MSSEDAVIRIAEQLRVATSYAMIFGHLPDGDIETRKTELRKRFAYLVKQVHPDHAPEAVAEQAKRAVSYLIELWRSANDAIDAGTYDIPFPPKRGSDSGRARSVDLELQSSIGAYRLSGEPFRVGDFSVLYRGRAVSGKVNGEVVVKIASEPRNNVWLEHEVKILKLFRDGRSEGLQRIQDFVPEVLDTFFVSGEHGTRFRAVVERYVPGLVSVKEIIEAYPRGLDPRDAAWIFRRVLAQTLAASMAGVVHGALVPDHVLVDPLKHEPFHIGWAHAVSGGDGTSGRITHVINRWRDLYPPEVFARQPVDHHSDIYMAGKTMILLLGGNPKTNNLPDAVPKQVAQAVLRCVAINPAHRWKSGKLALDGFTDVVRSLWGRVYRPLHIK